MTGDKKFSSNLDSIKEKLAKGEVAIGTHVKIGNPEETDILCNCGFDIIWVDGEHGSMDRKDINHQISTIRGAGIAPFARVPWNDPVLAKPILEMGPAAIIFPLIRSAEEAKKAVESCKYPPRGTRGFGPIKANNYGTMNNKEYLELADREPWVILQIEHIDGIKDLKNIIKVDGVDSVVIGPSDLSGSIGFLGQTRHPEVLKLMDEFANVCREADFPFGTSMMFDHQSVSEWIDRGVNWICVDTDIYYLLNGGMNTLYNTRKIIKNQASLNKTR